MLWSTTSSRGSLLIRLPIFIHPNPIQLPYQREVHPPPSLHLPPSTYKNPLLTHVTVWTTLITNTGYLSGLLTLDFSLKQVDSKYPLVALYTDTFPVEGHKALDRRGIPKRHIPYLLPAVKVDYSNDPRFYDCWSKLTPFSLTDFDRVVQLDADMLVRKNMDELMDLELDPPGQGGKGDRVFAAGHACVCNPLKKRHYPADWIPANCAFTTQHSNPGLAQTEAPLTTASPLGYMNGGLQVVNPSKDVYQLIIDYLNSDKVPDLAFADQSLLSDLFRNRWVPLPYIYNALKTMRKEGVHSEIWQDDQVKNVHYILSPKPWDEYETVPVNRKSFLEGAFAKNKQKVSTATDVSHKWWQAMNIMRIVEEQSEGRSTDAVRHWDGW